MLIIAPLVLTFATAAAAPPSGIYQGDFQAGPYLLTFSFNFHEPGKVDCVQDGPYRNEVDGEPYALDSSGVNFTRTDPASLPKFTSLLGSIFMTAADRFHFSHDPVTDVVYIIADDRPNDSGATITLAKKAQGGGRRPALSVIAQPLAKKPVGRAMAAKVAHHA